jgi:hypothetical protein
MCQPRQPWNVLDLNRKPFLVFLNAAKVLQFIRKRGLRPNESCCRKLCFGDLGSKGLAGLFS